MSLQRNRADKYHLQPDGAKVWEAVWYGGPTLAKVEGARVPGLGKARVTAYPTGEPDTWFSQPCKFRWMGKVLNGYFTGDEQGNLVVQHCYY